jgi:hypothetical protein
MVRRPWLPSLTLAALAAWPGAALASGHALSGIGDAIVTVLLLGGLFSFLFWAFSWWLLTRPRSAWVWFGGTAVSAVILPICFWVSKGERNEMRNLLVVVGVLPSALHQLKVLAPYLRKEPSQ